MNIISKKKAEDYELTNPVFYIEAAGVSSDAKPTGGVAAGSVFTEVDTGDVYMYSGSAWVKQFGLQG